MSGLACSSANDGGADQGGDRRRRIAALCSIILRRRDIQFSQVTSTASTYLLACYLSMIITASILIYSSGETDVSITVIKGEEYTVAISNLILIMTMPNLEKKMRQE